MIKYDILMLLKIKLKTSQMNKIIFSRLIYDCIIHRSYKCMKYLINKYDYQIEYRINLFDRGRNDYKFVKLIKDKRFTTHSLELALNDCIINNNYIMFDMLINHKSLSPEVIDFKFNKCIEYGLTKHCESIIKFNGHKDIEVFKNTLTDLFYHLKYSNPPIEYKEITQLLFNNFDKLPMIKQMKELGVSYREYL